MYALENKIKGTVWLSRLYYLLTIFLMKNNVLFFHTKKVHCSLLPDLDQAKHEVCFFWQWTFSFVDTLNLLNCFSVPLQKRLPVRCRIAWYKLPGISIIIAILPHYVSERFMVFVNNCSPKISTLHEHRKWLHDVGSIHSTTASFRGYRYYL